MQDNIFLPKKIKIGFQERSDTYTQKLAYVIYYDEKNKLRKEQSWNSWRDKKIDPQDFDNVHTSGFVLNKKVGGYKYDWNVRNVYVRVYDPRGFEFEITIPNLLFILENTSSIKGKGLEGDFIYGWSGAELLLIPTSSPQYVELSKLNDLRHSKNHIKSKDLILGATYLHKSNVHMIYMGKFVKYEDKRWSYSASATKVGNALGEHFFFIELHKQTSNDDENSYRKQTHNIKTFKSLSDYFIDVIDNSSANNYAHLMEIIEKSPIFSPITKLEYVPYTLPEFIKHFKKTSYKTIYLNKNDEYIDCYVTNYYDGKLTFQSYGSAYRSSLRKNFDTIELLFNELNPHYKNSYLANGKLFETTK